MIIFFIMHGVEFHLTAKYTIIPLKLYHTQFIRHFK